MSLLLALLALLACRSGPRPAPSTAQVDTPATGLPLRPPDTGVAAGLEGEPGLRPSPARHPLLAVDGQGFVVDVVEAPPPWSCDEGQAHSALCVEDYRALAQGRFRGSARKLAACVDTTRDRLLALRQQVDRRGTRPRRGMDDAGLQRELRERLRLDALASEAPVHLSAGPVEDRGDHLQVDFVLWDPVVGRFPGRLLLPAVPVEAPGLLLLPGHMSEGGRQLDEMADRYHGRTLAAEGHAVLIIGFRAYDAGPAEYQAGLELACAGLSLGALRVHEATVALDLLRALEPGEVVGERVGVLGHSGGAVWAVLLAAVEPVDAVVMDATSRQFLGVERSTDGAYVQVLDETLPALVDLFDCVYSPGVPVPLEDLACTRPPTPTPHLWVPYGYRAEDMARVRRFLGEALEARGSW